MSYYVVNNLLKSSVEYFVPDEFTKNANNHLVCIVGTQDDANKRAEQNKKEFLDNESYRFSIAKETVNGSDTTWESANINTDSEDGAYYVFNHLTGLHEKISSLSAAVNRMEQLKNDFISPLPLGVEVIDTLPPKTTTYSPTLYGNTVGSIPVEVM